ncbi:MAG TPA: hypothetical protein VFU32_15270 [Ktedonobacterales bacterium]|nr:hypothetical protein [Ktedonobacterales bacterium]
MPAEFTDSGAPPGATTLEGSALLLKDNQTGVLPGRPWLLLGGNLVLLAATALYHYAIYLPQPDRPHRFTALDDLFALGLVELIGLAGLALGMRLLRPFRLAGFSRLERGALAVGLGWGVFSLSILFIGLAHLLYAWVLAAALGLVLAICWREVWRVFALLTWQRCLHLLRRLLPRSFLARALAVILLIECAVLGLQGLTLPYVPYGSDLYLYHWPASQLYLLHHAVIVWPGWAAVDVPMNSELLATLALAFRSEIAALWLQIVFGALLVLLLAGWLGRRFGPLAAWIGVALCCASPLFTSLLTSGKTEMGASYYGIASLVIVLAWLESGQRGDQPPRRLLALAGVFAGCGLGTKYTEGEVVAGIALLLISLSAFRVLDAWRRGEPRWPALWSRFADLLVYGAFCLLPLLPWLIRDWALLGNPIYPFLWGGAGWNTARLLTWTSAVAHVGPQGTVWQRLAENLLSLFFDERRSGEPFYTPANYLLLAALLALVVLLVGRLRVKRMSMLVQPPTTDAIQQTLPWLVVAAGAYVAWVVGQAQLERYALAWLLLLVAPAALVLERLARLRWQWPFGRVMAHVARLGIPILLLGLVVLMGPLYSVPLFPSRNPLPLLTGQVSQQQWEQQHLLSPDYWEMADYINKEVPRSAKLLVIGSGYFLEGRDYVDDAFLDWVPYLETEGHTPAGIVALLRQNGFAYLLYDESLLKYIVKTNNDTYLSSFLPPFRAFLAQSLTPVRHFGNYELYYVPGP